MVKNDLLNLIDLTFTLVKNLEEEYSRKIHSWDVKYSKYFLFFYSNFDSMKSIIQLMSSSKYKDCFILLRSIMEYYFFLLLLIKGRKYRIMRTFKIIPENSRSKSEARDKTLEKWKNEKNLKPEIIDIYSGSEDDEIDVLYEFEGLYENSDVEKTGEIIAFYNFVIENYNPIVCFLGELPTLYRFGRTSFKKILKRQKELYHRYFHIKSIVKNLELSQLITAEQKDRFLVHYNFFSMFLHVTDRGLMNIDIRKYCESESERKDEIFENLIQRYVAHFQAMFIKLIVEYLEQKNPEVDLSNYKIHAEELEKNAKDFWFIYNNPTQFDIDQSDAQKKWMKYEGTKIPNTILYYEDPIERMKKIQSYK